MGRDLSWNRSLTARGSFTTLFSLTCVFFIAPRISRDDTSTSSRSLGSALGAGSALGGGLARGLGGGLFLSVTLLGALFGVSSREDFLLGSLGGSRGRGGAVEVGGSSTFTHPSSSSCRGDMAYGVGLGTVGGVLLRGAATGALGGGDLREDQMSYNTDYSGCCHAHYLHF